MRRWTTLLAMALTLVSQAQDLRELYRYDETNSALEGHTTQILQGRDGLLWIATWNGLCRFDGYEFVQLKPQAGDGCSISSDRIRDIWLADDGDIYLRADDDIYRFDTRTYRFSDMADDGERQQAENSLLNQPTRGKRKNGFFYITDQQGLEWQIRDDALYCMSPVVRPALPLPMEQKAMVRCIQRDSKGRVWVATRDDATVRLLDGEGHPLGYLSANGTLTDRCQTFGHAVYCLTETRSGHLFLGTKPDGLFRLTEQAEGRFAVEPVGGLSNNQVYGIAEDRWGRLWVATLGGGIACIEHPEAAHPQVVSTWADYPANLCQSVRHIHITGDTLLAATTEGLIVGKLTGNLQKIRFHRHSKEPYRQDCLTCNATMDIAEDAAGHLFVATETGGICEIMSDNLLADTLSFRHYNLQNGLLPTDMTLSMTPVADGRWLVVCPKQMVYLDTKAGTYENLDHHFFHEILRFSEARPLLTGDGRWLIPTLEGAVWLPLGEMRRSNYQPPLLLTSISTLHKQGQGDTENLAVTMLDTLRLSPSERSITVRFSALDYTDPQAVNYQFRLDSEGTDWTNLGHNHSVTLLDLRPGTYHLAIRSTNSDGTWTDNTRTLTIIVEPTFWETPWAVVLFIVLALAVVGSIVYTLLYIRRIKRRQQETLAAYLSLLEQMETKETPQPTEQTSDPFMQQVLAFVEANISNSEVDVNQMAEACAVSRSVLQRKMKQLMGVSPADFLREARIKHACQLLKNADSIVADVAYKCGFNDPKYFSRCFKQSVGVSPSEYKNQVK
ncbi:MAG: helix-turn-helix domain-containing protein [Prevotella sp.]|nr:helix-turn-helix domain-containing protein [Prevotella sp.]